jgi:hypothetical protein
MPLLPVVRALLGAARMSDDGILHFNPWMDFNDGPPSENPFGCDPDPEQIAIFLDTVFSWCEGLIPLRGFVDKGQGRDGKPHNIWIPADETATEKLATFAAWANREGAAVYVIPGTVEEQGQARAADVLQMQAIVVDLDAGDIPAKLDHVTRHIGTPTLIVESGGRTPEGAAKLHVWWKLTEPAEGDDLATLCRLRGEIAVKVGGDTHFRSAHQPIRVPGTVYHKHGHQRLVQIREHRDVEMDLADFADKVAEMPPLPGVGFASDAAAPTAKPGIDAVLTTPVREGAVDEWSRFQGASAAIGHYVRLVHEGRLDPFAGWEAICGYNAAMLRPSWPLDRLQAESERLWELHVKRNGPPLLRAAYVDAPASPLPTFSLGALLDDTSPMPEDIIGPRVLTPGGLLVLGGAPKVGKSDFLICWLVHMAAGVPFLGFTPPRSLRIFYLQAEIQYHYLRERLKQIALPHDVLAAARDTFVATPKLKMLLDNEGSVRVARAIQTAFPDSPPDIICVDPIRNLFDGGPDNGGENDNAAMMFFLKERIEVLRDHIDPDCGVILVHHTKKLSKHQVKEDPFLALSGASALRGFYTTGLILHRPDEESTERKLEIELRNGPALPAKLIDKRHGAWVELNPMNERLVRQEVGAKHDAERNRKGDVILSMLFEEAAEGRLYTSTQFGAAFENQHGLGSEFTIRQRLNVLATKGFVKFRRDLAEHGYPATRSHFGYLCVEEMRFGRDPVIDPDTGEVLAEGDPVLPTHFKCPHSGRAREVENSAVWVYPEGLEE